VSFQRCAECATDTDCPSATPRCVSTAGGGGTCEACATDQDCAVGVCFQNACVPGCSPQNPCQNPLTRCSAAQRCEAIPCDGSAACPNNMQCSSGHCARIVCSSDAECTGHCVNQECQESLGTCHIQMFYQ
jgi:hypothetical protein